MTIREIFETFMSANQIPMAVFETQQGTPAHLGLKLKGDHGDFESYAMCFEEERMFLFYTLLNLRVPEEKWDVMARKLMEINNTLKVGGFQLDTDTGAVTVRVTQYMFGSDLEQGAQIERLVRTCGLIADEYYLELAKILAN